MQSLRVACALIAVSLALPMAWPPDCRLDAAQVETVDPATFSVLATLRCGGIVCFVRYVETGGVRIREHRACEAGDMTRTLIVPPGGNLP